MSESAVSRVRLAVREARARATAALHLAAALPSGRAGLRPRIWAALAVCGLFVVFHPWTFFLLYMQVPFMVLVGLIGWLPRRRVADGLWLALPVLAAHAVEPRVGPWVMALMVLGGYALTRRPRLSSVLGASLFTLLVAAMELKLRFAGTRLTWYDFRFFFAQFRDNVGVMASQPTLVGYAGLAFSGTAALAYLGWRLDRREHALAASRAHWGAAVAAALVAGYGAFLVQGEVGEQVRVATGWRLAETPGRSEVPISRFIATFYLRPAWLPPPNDTHAFLAAVRERQSRSGREGRRADIVVFLQESQFNPRTWRGCPESLCRFPVFESGADTVAHGPLRVHVFGGGTWLSEFTLATGVPHDAFGPGGSFAPFNIAPGTRRSFIRSLKAAGYRTVAVYPTRGGMMNGRLAYGAYGFDAFYDSEDLGLPGHFLTPDALLHAAALRVLERERAHGQPLLLWAVTVGNHAEHGVRMEHVAPELVARARTAFPDGVEAETVGDYLSRTKLFEDAFAATSKVVLQGPRPAVLAWFGDHQPPFANAVPLRARVETARVPGNRVPARFQTWYAIRSNLSATHALASGAMPLDIAFLPGMLAEAAGVPQDEWIAANVTARDLCGGLLDECSRPEIRDGYLSYLRGDLKAIVLP